MHRLLNAGSLHDGCHRLLDWLLACARSRHAEREQVCSDAVQIVGVAQAYDVADSCEGASDCEVLTRAIRLVFDPLSHGADKARRALEIDV